MAEEQLVYRFGKGQKRTTFRRASQRDPALLSYQESCGSPGARLTGLRGHMTLAYDVKRALGDDPEFNKKVADMFLRRLRSQFQR